MAIRERSDRRLSWQVYWNNPWTGKRESKSFATRIEAEEHDSLVRHRLKYQPETFDHDEEEGEPPERTSLEAVCYAYLRDRQLAPRNLRDTLYHLQGVLRAIGPVSAAELDKATMLRAVQTLRNERGLKQNTIARRVGIVKAALNWAEDQGLIPANPIARFSCPPGRDQSIPPPTPAEVEAILAVAPPRVARVIFISLAIGARVGPSELFALRWADFDLDRATVRVPNAAKGADRTWRDLHLRSDVAPLLAMWKAKDAEARARGVARFARLHRREPEVYYEHVIHLNGYAVRSLKKIWKQTLLKAGVTRRIRPYDLRHAFATNALAAGADPKAVAEVMGHRDMAMIHRHYQHVMNQQRKAALEAGELPLGTFSGHMDGPADEHFWAHFAVADERKIN